MIHMAKGRFHRTVSAWMFCLAFVFPSVVQSQNFDINTLKSINPKYPTSDFWKVTSSSAYWVPALTAAGEFTYGVIHQDKFSKQRAYELLINIGVSSAITGAGKIIFHRKRPEESYPNEVYVISPTHGRSFPSGHASLAFATATTLALEYKKWYIVVPAYLWAGSIGYSRMYLGKHYPSDVLAGAAVGVGSGYLSHWLSYKLFRHRIFQ